MITLSHPKATMFCVWPSPDKNRPSLIRNEACEWSFRSMTAEGEGFLNLVKCNGRVSGDGRQQAAIVSTEQDSDSKRWRYRLVVAPAGSQAVRFSEHDLEWSAHDKFVMYRCPYTSRLMIWSVDAVVADPLSGPVFSLDKKQSTYLSWSAGDKWLAFCTQDMAVVVVSTNEWRTPVFASEPGRRQMQFVGGQTLSVRYNRTSRLYGPQEEDPGNNDNQWTCVGERTRRMQNMVVRRAENGNECWVEFNWKRARCAVVCPTKTNDTRREWTLPRGALGPFYEHCFANIVWSTDSRYVLITAGNQNDMGGWCVVVYAAPDWQPITWCYLERMGSSQKYHRWIDTDVIEYRSDSDSRVRCVKIDWRSPIRWLELSRKAAASVAAADVT